MCFPLGWFDFTQAKCQTNQNLSTNHIRAVTHSLVTNDVFFCGRRKEGLLSSRIWNVIQNGPAEFTSPHNCGSHLGHTSSRDNRAKRYLWKHFKATSGEQCVASHHENNNNSIIIIIIIIAMHSTAEYALYAQCSLYSLDRGHIMFILQTIVCVVFIRIWLQSLYSHQPKQTALTKKLDHIPFWLDRTAPEWKHP